jgi:hypothetical protein
VDVIVYVPQIFSGITNVFISVVVHVISFQNIMCVFVYYLYRLSVLFYITYNSVHVFVHSFSLSYYYSFFYKHDYTMYTATDTYIYTHIYPTQPLILLLIIETVIWAFYTIIIVHTHISSCSDL